jgi:uncharacterized protein
MPVSPTYPGIYIQEAPSSSHTITAAPTNIAVFIGYAHPLKTVPANYGQAVQIFSFADYQRQFGGFVRSAAFTNANDPNGIPGAFGDLAQAVNQFFLNGGTTAYVVALDNNKLQNKLTTPSTVSVGGVTFTAIEVTDEWYSMTVSIRPIVPVSTAGDPLADITITYGPGSSPVSSHSPPHSPPSSPATTLGAGSVIETFRRVSLNQFQSDGKTTNPHFIETAINSVSQLVTVSAGSPPGSSWQSGPQTFPPFLSSSSQFYDPKDYTGVLQEDTDLDKVQVFNLMVLPGIADNSLSRSDASGALILSTAIAFCERKLAFLVMDPPIADSADGTFPPASNPIQATAGDPSLPRSKNAALYFPYLLSPDPITGSSSNIVTGLPSQIPPAATVAGIYAATDLARGVWKAPAGFQAVTNNVTGVVASGRMTDQRQGVLNPLGVNCLRIFPNLPTIVFGSRTLATTYDQQWTYVPVRRMALFLEQTFYANLKWVIFEPNADPLWSAITMSINAFMLGLFKQGAFQGDTPSKAFIVQCNGTTTTQADIDNGIVNIVVGFAPLKPAEFVIITIAQLAGQTQTS